MYIVVNILVCLALIFAWGYIAEYMDIFNSFDEPYTDQPAIGGRVYVEPTINSPEQFNELRVAADLTWQELVRQQQARHEPYRYPNHDAIMQQQDQMNQNQAQNLMNQAGGMGVALQGGALGQFFNEPQDHLNGLAFQHTINNTAYTIGQLAKAFKPFSLDESIETMEKALWSSRKSPITKKDIK
jgi:hypothetical protein